MIGAAGALLAACHRNEALTVSRTPRLHMRRLDREIGAIAARAAPGALGFGLMNLESGQFWVRLDARPFPMMSVAKLPIACAVLAEMEARRLTLADPLTLTDVELSPPPSPIADAWPGRTAYSAGELLTAAVVDADNTAADLLMKRIGGPGAVEAWLQGKKVDEVRVDRYAREVLPALFGMASFRAAWKGAAAFQAAVTGVPPDRRRAATLTFLADPRDTATPRGMLGFLRRLHDGELLSDASVQRLTALMTQVPRAGDGLKAGLPAGAAFAHMPGASATDQGLTAADNDAGIFTLPDRRSYAIAAFLSGSTAPERDRAGLFADLARAAVRAVG
jgi:beta-lactamase class A